MTERATSEPGPDERQMAASVAAVIRKHVRLEWHGHDHADINHRSVQSAAEAIAAQIYSTLRSVASELNAGIDAATSIEARVGGAYEMPDGRKFWIDAPVAREIARRAIGGRA
ncbi:hypothetical protein D9Y22_12290 [Methylorubrum sp. DB1722]|nr:hypothetical protein [Methylorubrum sp. DB1722]